MTALAANAFALGLADTEVSGLLRHSNTQVTLTMYDGVVEGEVAKRLGQQMAERGFGA